MTKWERVVESEADYGMKKSQFKERKEVKLYCDQLLIFFFLVGQAYPPKLTLWVSSLSLDFH